MQLNRSLADKIDLDPNKTRALIARFFAVLGRAYMVYTQRGKLATFNCCEASGRNKPKIGNRASARPKRIL